MQSRWLAHGLAACLFGCAAEPSDPILIAGACGEIVDACHTKDDGTPGQVNDCHGIAHDEVEADCSRVHAMCIEVCNAAPTVVHETDDHGGSESESDENGTTEHGSTEEGTTEHGDGSTSSGGPSESSSGTSSEGSSSSGSSGGVEPNCGDLGSGCHDSATPLGVMCHDVGHEGDEVACAEIWAECKAECGF